MVFFVSLTQTLNADFIITEYTVKSYQFEQEHRINLFIKTISKSTHSYCYLGKVFDLDGLLVYKIREDLSHTIKSS